MGVHEMGLRKSILREIENFKVSKEEEKAAAKLKRINMDEVRKSI